VPGRFQGCSSAWLGYPFGTAGVLIGGVVGTFVGDQLEYNRRKRRMEKLLGE
jgi:hypothetical protein